MSMHRVRVSSVVLLALSLNVGSIPAACIFGGVYVASSVAAFRQIARTARPDSHKAFNCYGEAVVALGCYFAFEWCADKPPQVTSATS